MRELQLSNEDLDKSIPSESINESKIIAKSTPASQQNKSTKVLQSKILPYQYSVVLQKKNQKQKTTKSQNSSSDSSPKRQKSEILLPKTVKTNTNKFNHNQKKREQVLETIMALQVTLQKTANLLQNNQNSREMSNYGKLGRMQTILNAKMAVDANQLYRIACQLS